MSKQADADEDTGAQSAVGWGGHTFHKCSAERCYVCDGGLSLCDVCGGFEGSILPTCPGQKLTAAEHDKNYADYCAGRGAFAVPS